MKASKRIVILMTFIFAGLCTLSAQSKKEKKEEVEKAVKELVESENYKIIVNTAYPRRGRMIPLTSLYSVEVRNDSVFSQLPYFGRAYSIPYGGGNGLMFEAPITRYLMKTNKRGAAKVDFSARSREDYFKYRITVYSNGSASIDVTMQNRESISFSGEVEVKPTPP